MREKIAQMTVDCFAAESAVVDGRALHRPGCEDYSIEAAISKVFASERDAARGLRGAADRRPATASCASMPYEQIARDARILPIFEGTNEILRLYVALSCLKDVGETLTELKSAAAAIFNDPIKGFGVLSDYAERRFAQATGVGRDKVVTRSPRRCGRSPTTTRSTRRGSRAPPTKRCARSASASPTTRRCRSGSPTS